MCEAQHLTRERQSLYQAPIAMVRTTPLHHCQGVPNIWLRQNRVLRGCRVTHQMNLSLTSHTRVAPSYTRGILQIRTPSANPQNPMSANQSCTWLKTLGRWCAVAKLENASMCSHLLISRPSKYSRGRGQNTDQLTQRASRRQFASRWIHLCL